MLINYCVGGVMNENMEMVRFCRGFLRGVSDLPIRPSEFAVLEILCAVPGAHTPASLAEKLGVSKPMLSAHLSSLIRRGVVLRVPSPEDGRSTYVVPTKMGKELFKKNSGNIVITIVEERPISDEIRHTCFILFLHILVMMYNGSKIFASQFTKN